ncbi:MAG: Xaa-Pro peptidase family protein, partial [candidate division Zixibacteria bacterium]
MKNCLANSSGGFSVQMVAAITNLVLCFFIASTVTAADPEPIGMETFKARRNLLLDSLAEGTAILYSQGEWTGTGYQADGHFWYLTGTNEPGAILVLAPGETDREVLLLKPRDTESERWTGERPALTDSLKEALGFGRIRRTGSLNRYLVSPMKREPILHLISRLVSPSSEVGKDLALYRKVSSRIPGVSIENSSRFIESMRMVKSSDEIKAVEKAIDVTYYGITDLLARLVPGLTEYQLDGILEESFKRQGSQHMAFSPIVGAGKETTILHYETRDHVVKAGQLLLLDVGAKWDGYCADISRTFPVDGKFTPEQAKIYDIVYRAQQAGIAAVKPGATIRDVDDAARGVIRAAGYGEAFIHGTSHHLGLDVHDVSDGSLPLKPGMIITVEPGIYLTELEIGVRIEDDV